MNKQTFQAIRRSIRDNGLRYTAQHAMDTGNDRVLMVCDSLANLLQQTDWLAMRSMFARTGEKPSIAFKLTTNCKGV